MRAAILKNYGGPDSISIRELPTPEPRDNEILVKVKATTVTGVDNIFRSGTQIFARMATGIIKPKIPVLGTELS